MVDMNQPLSAAAHEQQSRERFDAGRIGRPVAVRTADDVKVGGPPDRIAEIVDFKSPARMSSSTFVGHSTTFALTLPVQRPRLWVHNPNYFFEDAVGVRRQQEKKVQFFRDYNIFLAEKFNTTASAFNLWANHLAYIHPPAGTLISLGLPPEKGYDRLYVFKTAIVSHTAEVVAHLLVPNKAGRLIILFRGTAPAPATYMDADQTLRLEPTGFGADTDFVGVGFAAHRHIADQISVWTKKFERGRGTTFIGHSLGGALALRAHHAQCDAGPSVSSRAYVYSPAGLDLWTAKVMESGLSANLKTIGAAWHQDDFISKTGHFPSMRGIEIRSSPFDSFPHLRGASYIVGESDRHGLPFLALWVGWRKTIFFVRREKPDHHLVSNLARGAVRRNPIVAAVGQIANRVIRYKHDAFLGSSGLLMSVPVGPACLFRMVPFTELERNQLAEMAAKHLCPR
jgi:pimeloyl-ACP methyl ester carboxylesterase